MICITDKIRVQKPYKRQAGNGTQFWTFYFSLGKYTKGKNAGKFKGNLNAVCFDTKIELTDKMDLFNVKFDLFTETKEGKEYFKAVVVSFDKPKGVSAEDIDNLVNVNDAIPPLETKPVVTTQFGEKIIEIPKDEIDKDLLDAINGKEVL